LNAVNPSRCRTDGNSDWSNQIAEPFTLERRRRGHCPQLFHQHPAGQRGQHHHPRGCDHLFRIGYYDINYTNDGGDKSEAGSKVDFDYYVPYILNSTATATLNSITVRGYEGEVFEGSVTYVDITENYRMLMVTAEE
jgi:hypothetical protein